MTSEPGSFARSTIVERKPQIIRQVIEDNDYPPDIVAALEAFRDKIASRPMQPLSEQAPDVAFWNRQLAAYEGRMWLDAPWYFAETYFYRRLLEAARYFQAGPWERRDPFGKQKRQQEEAAAKRLVESWGQLAEAEPEVASYFPAPFLVLRMLKGEIMVGLQPGQAEALAAEDPTWLINGQRGIVQLVQNDRHR